MNDAGPAIRALRDHRVGVLLADGLVSAVRFMIDGRTGRLVFPCGPLVFDAEELVLHTPEEGDDALQLLVHAAPADPATDPACDRWLAAFGTPDVTRWAACTIESGRFGGAVLDGELLTLVNPLLTVEAGLIRRLNADRAALTRLCTRYAGVEVPEPLCVGVDPGGVDVRARFGVVRVPFDVEATTPERADAQLNAMLSGGGGARP
ncbi:MAG: DUF2470 domain-containing protein [Phycisphaerales bacterium]